MGVAAALQRLPQGSACLDGDGDRQSVNITYWRESFTGVLANCGTTRLVRVLLRLQRKICEKLNPSDGGFPSAVDLYDLFVWSVLSRPASTVNLSKLQTEG